MSREAIGKKIRDENVLLLINYDYLMKRELRT